eukprot:TRINITY_DN204_c0_g1_i2.p1 TRINITY_DN204_c0_g1~~TRINITY_DN204_c0_g1_i2.p1  ORF type:complete len:222 (-),score=61.55 TRINITY_DN204_c0_g1_i2:407-1072(-)
MSDKAKGKIAEDAKGIPVKSTYPEGISVPLMYTLFNSVLTAIGVGIAYFAVYRQNSVKADAKIQLLASYELGWIYIGAWVLKVGQLLMNMVLGSARKKAKVNVPDQQVYKVKGAQGSSLGYVMMEQDGALGAFNRAQRALQNYNEIYTQFAVYFLLAGLVFPFPVFVIGCLFAAFRVFGAVGYTGSADGRMGGNMLSFATVSVLEGLVLVAGVQAIRGDYF